jgi:hypothetical protein
MYALLMPRRARIAPGETIYHALNRANGRNQLFDKPEDYVDRFHGTYPPNINEGTHLISVKGPTQYQVVPLVF